MSIHYIVATPRRHYTPWRPSVVCTNPLPVSLLHSARLHFRHEKAATRMAATALALSQISSGVQQILKRKVNYSNLWHLMSSRCCFICSWSES